MLALLTSGHVAGAEELVLHRFTSATPSHEIEEILYLTAGVELVEAGLSSSRTADVDRADYVLNTVYRITGETVELRYRLQRTEPPEAGVGAGELSITVSLDSNLDGNIGRAIERLLAAASVERLPNQEARIAEYSQAPAGVADSASGDEPGQERLPKSMRPPEELDQPDQREELEPSRTDDLPDDSASPPTPESPEEQNPPDQSVAELDRSSGLRLTLFGGSVFPLGEAHTVFRGGVAGGLSAGFGRARSGVEVILGAHITACRLFPDDGISGGALDMLAMGPEIRLDYGDPETVRLGGGVSAGVVAMSIVKSDARLTKVAPHAAAGITARVAVGSRISVGFGLNSFAVYEASLPLFGIVPEVRMAFEL
ncbi:MAG: hypothetical protein WD492_11930 [Alkalispirochaeta sp.]